MEGTEHTLLILLLILGMALVVPDLFRKFRLPYVTALIIAGAVAGPFGIGFIEVDQTVSFFGFLGLTFLMLMAGLETRVDLLQKSFGKVMLMSLFNGGIPAVVGFVLMKFFGYETIQAIFVSIIFISFGFKIR